MKRNPALWAFLAVLLSSCANSEPTDKKSSTSATAPQAVNDANFEKEVLLSKEPVLVDFWAPWCGPCLAIGPVVDELADDLQGKVKVVKLNIDDAQGIAQKYGVRAIPTFILYKDGEIVQRSQGSPAQSKTAFAAWVNSALK